jgi:diketogulonate reductase-like aldo/keto reductase
VLAIPGTASAGHLEENAGAARVELTDEDVRRLERSTLLRYRARRLARRARAGAGRVKRTVRR